MGSKWQEKQHELPFSDAGEGEAHNHFTKDVADPTADPGDERRPPTAGLMEEICTEENINEALKRVVRNKGAPGVDGMPVGRLTAYLRRRWTTHRDQLLSGTYQPFPVRRVEIPKPSGGKRELGIPTALDRFVQQATLQVLQRRWDASFSERSYGFRPGRSAAQAVRQAQHYVGEGYTYVVDLDLERFFDRVNQDKLMAMVAKREQDKRLLKLIRAFLNAGVLEDGLTRASTGEGVPQGGPLSPLLSNLYLDTLDRELERRGHRFVRYADDVNIYVRSERAGQRVLESVTSFVEKKLKLRVNSAKTAVDKPAKRKFLGFTVSAGKKPKRHISPAAKKRFRRRVKELTRRTRGKSLRQVVDELTPFLRGWGGYYGHCDTPTVLAALNGWVRRRLRSLLWQQWRTPRRRAEALRHLGIRKQEARDIASSSKGPWRMSLCPTLNNALSNSFFDAAGVHRLTVLEGA